MEKRESIHKTWHDTALVRILVGLVAGSSGDGRPTFVHGYSKGVEKAFETKMRSIYIRVYHCRFHCFVIALVETYIQG